jgi:pyruvate/2-oxoglutarate dehydrogenase complex dihydrolipoamide acyltransferase (E2) component
MSDGEQKSVDITMPKLSDTMTEGFIARWIKNVGDEVTAGEDLAEVETDKAVVTISAPCSGILLDATEPSDELPIAVGTIIARISTTASA